MPKEKGGLSNSGKEEDHGETPRNRVGEDRHFPVGELSELERNRGRRRKEGMVLAGRRKSLG